MKTIFVFLRNHVARFAKWVVKFMYNHLRFAMKDVKSFIDNPIQLIVGLVSLTGIVVISALFYKVLSNTNISEGITAFVAAYLCMGMMTILGYVLSAHFAHDTTGARLVGHLSSLLVLMASTTFSILANGGDVNAQVALGLLTASVVYNNIVSPVIKLVDYFVWVDRVKLLIRTQDITAKVRALEAAIKKMAHKAVKLFSRAKTTLAATWKGATISWEFLRFDLFGRRLCFSI